MCDGFYIWEDDVGAEGVLYGLYYYMIVGFDIAQLPLLV